MEVTEDTKSERSPRCDDCRIPTRLQARIFDVRKSGHVTVYDCPTCKRLYWKD
jgi:hypothetical protein